MKPRTRTYLTPADGPEILANAGPTMSVPQAAACMGITESTGYLLVQAGEFPVPAIRLGRQWRVPTARVRELLGLPAAESSTGAVAS